MLRTKIYAAEYEVDQRLLAFDTTRAELIEVVRTVLGERDNAIDVDPLGTPGQFSYIFGNRHLRFLYLPKGWGIDRTENIESVLHPETGIKIIFQNVDQACNPFEGPKKISPVGPGNSRLIDRGQGSLFTEKEAPEAIPPERIKSLNQSAWYFCVSFSESGVSAELSLPGPVAGKNFGAFIERIFIVHGGDWGGIASSDIGGDSGPVNDLPSIARR